MAKNQSSGTQTQERPVSVKEDPLLSIKEAAVQLGMPYHTLYDWCKPRNGRPRRIRIVRRGPQFCIRQSTVDQILLGTDDQSEPVPDYKD